MINCNARNLLKQKKKSSFLLQFLNYHKPICFWAVKHLDCDISHISWTLKQTVCITVLWEINSFQLCNEDVDYRTNFLYLFKNHSNLYILCTWCFSEADINIFINKWNKLGEIAWINNNFVTRVTPTFAARNSVVPHHVAILEDAGDGLGAVGLHKAFLAQEWDGAAELQALTKALPINRNAGVWALIVTKRYRKYEHS